MKITTQDVKKIAALAHLELGADEIDGYTQHFSSILGYIEQISEVEASAAHAAENEVETTPMREDQTRPSFTRDEALANAPEKFEDFFLVPKVVD